MTKACQCGEVSLVFKSCTGEKCKTCKAEGHEPQVYCPKCETFTHPVYGAKP